MCKVLPTSTRNALATHVCDEPLHCSSPGRTPKTTWCVPVYNQMTHETVTYTQRRDHTCGPAVEIHLWRPRQTAVYSAPQMRESLSAHQGYLSPHTCVTSCSCDDLPMSGTHECTCPSSWHSCQLTPHTCAIRYLYSGDSPCSPRHSVTRTSRVPNMGGGGG